MLFIIAVIPLLIAATAYLLREYRSRALTDEVPVDPAVVDGCAPEDNLKAA